MSYTPTNWIDGETPVNADNLNKMEQGIKSNSEAIAGVSQIETPKIVSSVAEMTDPTKHYVLDGYIYHSKQVVVQGGVTSPNMFVPSTATLNGRISGSSGSVTQGASYNGYYVTDDISVKDIIANNTPFNVRINWELGSSAENKLVFFDSGGARLGTTLLQIGTNTTVSNGETVIDIKTMSSSSSTAPADWTKVASIKIQFVVRVGGDPLTLADVENHKITFDVNNVVTEPTVKNEWVNSGISYAPTFKTDLVGVLGDNNVIYLSDNLPAGTYTLKYPDDNYANVGTITK